MKFRELKKSIFDILNSDKDLKSLLDFPKKKVAIRLISFLSYPNDYIKKRAISALGIVVTKLADEDMEQARIIMRQFMWNLNDESGGIGWGVPEAMAEIMIKQERLCKEYLHILKSYAKGGGNYLDYEPLEREVDYAIRKINKFVEVFDENQ